MTKYKINLPCKIGDVVYYVNGDRYLYITEHIVTGFHIRKDGLCIEFENFKTHYPNERLCINHKAAIKEYNRRLLNYEN